MDQTEFKPWRSDGPASDPLAPEVGTKWSELLRDSKRAVAELRDATAAAEHHIDLAGHVVRGMREHAVQRFDHHQQILARLEAFEQRLDAMERRLSALAGQGPPLTPPRSHAA